MDDKLQLVRNGKVIFEIPLSPTGWPKKRLETELNSIEGRFERLSKFFDALSNETRLRMMKRMMEEDDHTMNFADFMRDLDLNPKLVWENSRKLREGGLMEKISRGKYRCSDFGIRGFMMMSFALRKLMEAFEDLEDFDEF
jgi:hypothetical protein